jgi:hypothetical protein
MPKRNGERIALLDDPTRRKIVAQIALVRGHPAQILAWLAGTEVGRKFPREEWGQPPDSDDPSA